MTLTLTYYLGIQSPASYGHGLLAFKVNGHSLREIEENKRTKRRTEAIALPAELIRSVIRYGTDGLAVFDTTDDRPRPLFRTADVLFQ